MDHLDDSLRPDHPAVEADPELRHDDDPEDVYDPRFDDPLSPDYVGPSQDFSAAGFLEVVEALEAPPLDTPERRAMFDRVRQVEHLVEQMMAKSEARRSAR